MRIRNEIFNIKGAPLEGLNPLPKFRARKPSVAKTDEDFPEIYKESLGYQSKVLPYLMQDRYTRRRDDLKLKSFVLENEYLIARFLPEYGGRLHSLFDKVSNRELLFANPVIQPCNIANRNAWLSGGIEWNVGNHGHTFTTCDNVFAAVLDDGEGNDFLRIYEFERNKSIFWQVDFHLPDGSPVLISHVRMVNPFPKDTTTYWWSNVAVPTDEHTRVLASNKTVISLVDGGCTINTLPNITAFPDRDATYPNNAPRAFDYFIQKDVDGESTWEAAAYDDGVVFYERSTAPLYCKKMFCWGNHRAGRHWQEFLSDGVGTGYYCELQAGVAPSQLHDLMFPAHSKYEWTQCFGGLKLDPERLFGDYNAAVEYFDGKLSATIDRDLIDKMNERYTSFADIPVTEDKLMHLGSGFGALEIERMKIDKDAVAPSNLCFPKSTLAKDEAPWLALLTDGKLPKASPTEAPLSYMVSEKWLPRLKALAEKSDDWAALMHYGVAVYEYQPTDVYVNKSYSPERDREQTEIAEKAWKRSLELAPSVWCLRNLAILAERASDAELCESYYDKALALPGVYDDYAIVSEYLIFLNKNKKYSKAWEIYTNLPENCKCVDRVKISAATAAVKIGKSDYLDAFFAEPHFDIREGEESLTNVWFEYCALKLAKERGIENPTEEKLAELFDEAWDSCPPDYSIDFRMSTDKKSKYRVGNS